MGITLANLPVFWYFSICTLYFSVFWHFPAAVTAPAAQHLSPYAGPPPRPGGRSEPSHQLTDRRAGVGWGDDEAGRFPRSAVAPGGARGSAGGWGETPGGGGGGEGGAVRGPREGGGGGGGSQVPFRARSAPRHLSLSRDGDVSPLPAAAGPNHLSNAAEAPEPPPHLAPLRSAPHGPPPPPLRGGEWDRRVRAAPPPSPHQRPPPGGRRAAGGDWLGRAERCGGGPRPAAEAGGKGPAWLAPARSPAGRRGGIT